LWLRDRQATSSHLDGDNKKLLVARRASNWVNEELFSITAFTEVMLDVKYNEMQTIAQDPILLSDEGLRS
jgi:hypothetical protein